MARASGDSKTKFLDAALGLIRTKGYEATTVDDLCAATGLTKGSFFHHFDGKEDLALGAAQHFATMADGLFAQAPFQAEADPLDRVLGYVDFRAKLMKGSLPEYTCLLGMMAQENYDTHPALRRACDKHISAHVKTLVPAIAEAKRRYVPRANFEPEDVAFYIQSVIHGAFVLAKAKNGPEVAVKCLAQLRQHLQTQFTPKIRK